MAKIAEVLVLRNALKDVENASERVETKLEKQREIQEKGPMLPRNALSTKSEKELKHEHKEEV